MHVVNKKGLKEEFKTRMPRLKEYLRNFLFQTSNLNRFRRVLFNSIYILLL